MTGGITRRLMIQAGAAAGLGAVARPAFAAAPSRLTVTPGQTEGPFYPVQDPAETDADLVRVRGAAAQAMGRIMHLSGRVLDRNGRPVPGAVVEIWQCDANGIYRHPAAPDQGGFDDGFQSYGRARVADGGLYRFRTIRPVAYPGRTPHIHFKVAAPGIGRLTTQMYVAGEPLNARDGVLNSIRDRAARASVIVPLADGAAVEQGALSAAFDIVLDV